MRHPRVALIINLFAALGIAGPAPPPAFEVRLLTPVSTFRSKPGDRVDALMVTRACLANGDALPEGAVIRGEVTHIHKVGLGLIHESAQLHLRFGELELPDGRSYSVATRVLRVDNARERVDSKGAIRGIRATATLSNRLGQRIALEAIEHPLVLVPVFALETGVLNFPDPEIEYGRGAEMYLAIDASGSLGSLAPCAQAAAGPSAADAAALRRMVEALPRWSYSKRQPQPMDAINLVYLGSEDALGAAFDAAGWSGSAPNSVRAGVNAVRAIAQESAYDEAPMRTLLLDGAEPDLRFQKSLNTFANRHHLRIWKRAAEISGKTVWASAATRDAGATFSLKPFGFTHKVEQPIDLERDKVVRDLAFTGCVDSVVYVPRPPAEPGASRKGVKTDNRVAVVMLNSCQTPRSLESSVVPKPWIGVRLVRRVTLTARNHFIRDNIFYRSFDAARLAARITWAWRKNRKAAPVQTAAAGSVP